MRMRHDQSHLVMCKGSRVHIKEKAEVSAEWAAVQTEAMQTQTDEALSFLVG